MKASVAGRLRNTSLPKSKPLLPVFEAVMNSFQAIDDSNHPGPHSVRITAVRQPTLGGGTGVSAVDAFTIVDSGIGFTQANYESFDTVDSDYKAPRGGKGLGRFLWLKAFERVEIDSHFFSPDGKAILRRRIPFDMSDSHGLISTTPSTEKIPQTTVHLIGYLSPYRDECPRGLDIIAQRLVGHFLPLLVAPEGPSIFLQDDHETIDLRVFFRDNIERIATTHPFDVGEERLNLMGFRLRGGIAEHHQIIYGAHYREVITERLSRFMPNLKTKLTDPDYGTFTYLAFVQGDYLNKSVTNDRTDFSIPKETPPDDDLLADQISLAAIRGGALAVIRQDLRPYLDEINVSKQARLADFVAETAPEYRVLLKHIADFIDQMPTVTTDAELDAFLHRQLYQRQVSLREEGARILAEAVDAADTEEYDQRFKSYLDKENEIGKSALAKYVAHRRVILDLLEKAISIDQASGKYPLEKAVHRLVFPMRATSEEVPSEQQNLWVIDERLSYHFFLSSDQALKTLPVLESDSASRPDILIFNRPLLFGDDGQPLTAMIVIEFKRADRSDYREESPMQQSFRMVREVREGKKKDNKGRLIRPASPTIPAYCYIICDLTPAVETIVQDAGAIRTPDNLGYYGFNINLNAYYEIISYTKLLDDAKKRNRILFQKLNLPPSN